MTPAAVTSSIARLHIEGIADERHYHDGLEQKITRLEVLLAELRAEWDEFIAAQLEMASVQHNHPPGTDHPLGIHGCPACAAEAGRLP